MHSVNGKLMSETGISFYMDLQMDFNPTSKVNVSSYFVDAGKLTRSGLPIIVTPDLNGINTVQKAKFKINLSGYKTEAEIMFFKRGATFKSELSFKIKDLTVGTEVLRVAQHLTLYLSQLRTIASLGATRSEQ